MATYNVLFDRRSHSNHATLPDVLHHGTRYDALCAELKAQDSDIIGLNEVTATVIERLLREDWVRERYWATEAIVPSEMFHGTRGFGNLILSRIRPSFLEYENSTHAVIAKFIIQPQGLGQQPITLTVASAHLMSLPWLNEGVRQREIQAISSRLQQISLTEDGAKHQRACVIMGDFNFHRESEQIPAEWREIPAVVDLGSTWDATRNPIISHYLPASNLYNGFGSGFGWSNQMRLDRVIVLGEALSGHEAKAWLFGTRLISGKTIPDSIALSGPELRSVHRSLPWEDYLTPSDHYGIALEIPFKDGIA